MAWWRDLDVLLLPGMDGTGRLYTRLLRALSESWRTTVVEFPGGEVAWYDELLPTVRSLAPEKPFLLVAESYSTPLAIRFASRRPEQLEALVLCAGFASSPVRGLPRLLVRLVGPVLFHLPLMSWVIQRYLLGVGADAALVEEVRAAIRAVRPEVLASRLKEILSCDVRSDLARIEVPILYLQAEGDRLVGTECLDEILRCKADIVVERIAGPHLLLQREPESATRAIVKFLGQIHMTMI